MLSSFPGVVPSGATLTIRVGDRTGFVEVAVAVRVAIVDEDIAASVRVTHYEVVAVRRERHVPAVRADVRVVVAVRRRLRAVARHAHPIGVGRAGFVEDAVLIGVAVMDVDVRLDVGVSGNQFQEREERHEPTVCAQGGTKTLASEVGEVRREPLAPVGPHADANDRSRYSVVDEDVLRVVGVPRDEVRRLGEIGDVPPVRADPRCAAPVVGLGAGVADVDTACGGHRPR